MSWKRELQQAVFLGEPAALERILARPGTISKLEHMIHLRSILGEKTDKNCFLHMYQGSKFFLEMNCIFKRTALSLKAHRKFS